jgi:hypothetical protein
MSITQAEADQRRPIIHGRLSAKMRKAVRSIVFDGKRWEDACAEANMHDLAFYRTLQKPIAIAYLNQQRKLLRTITCAGNEAAISQIRHDPNTNSLVKLKAVALLEHMDTQVSISSQATSTTEQRFNINIINRLDRANPQSITHALPTIEHEPPTDSNIKGLAKLVP